MTTKLIMAGITELPGMSANDINKLLEWHDNNKKILLNRGSIGLKKPWLHTKIRDNDLSKKGIQVDSNVLGSNWNLDFIEKFPHLVKVFDQLPLKYIEKIVILETIKDCEPHIDGSSSLYSDTDLEPCNYRMFLRKAKFSNGFYLQALDEKDFGIKPQKNIITNFPKKYFTADPGKWWVLNNWCCQHGSDWLENDSKTLISVLGTPSDQHKEILKSLYNKVFHPYVNQ